MGVIYRSLRVGLHGQTFNLLKIRTFKAGSDGGSPTASIDDPRLTAVGKWLREKKLDELPTLLSVIKRDMNIVGWRPEVQSEWETLDEETRSLLSSCRPGMIGLGVLWCPDEDQFLAGEADAHEAYCQKLKPKKMKLNREYVRRKSLIFDLRILLRFICKSLGLSFGKMTFYAEGELFEL